MRLRIWSAVAACASAALAVTAVPAADALDGTVVSVAGDIACGTGVAAYNNGDGTATACRQKYTAALLAGPDPTIPGDPVSPTSQVWTLGDHVYPKATLAQFNIAYAPTWGQYKAITKPTPGDHDALAGGSLSGYTKYFGASATYYSFEIAGWHVISLNSQLPHDAASAQVTWLKQDLASTSATCVAALWGEPRWSSGKKGPDLSFDPFIQALYAAHADLVLTGDVHNYERFAKQNPSSQPAADGIRAFVVGTGGRDLVGFPNSTRQPNSEARVKAFGILQLGLQPTSYSWQFVDEFHQVRDSGSDQCIP
jgi:hypothetical protein